MTDATNLRSLTTADKLIVGAADSDVIGVQHGDVATYFAHADSSGVIQAPAGLVIAKTSGTGCQSRY